ALLCPRPSPPSGGSRARFCESWPPRCECRRRFPCGVRRSRQHLTDEPFHFGLRNALPDGLNCTPRIALRAFQHSLESAPESHQVEALAMVPRPLERFSLIAAILCGHAPELLPSVVM